MLQMMSGYLRIHLSGFYASMSKQRLDIVDIGSIFQ